MSKLPHHEVGVIGAVPGALHDEVPVVAVLPDLETKRGHKIEPSPGSISTEHRGYTAQHRPEHAVLNKIYCMVQIMFTGAGTVA